MKLGVLTAPFPDTDLMEVADWTASEGMEALEIACWPAASGETRRYAGTSHIDVDGFSASKAEEITSALGAKGIEISFVDYIHYNEVCSQTIGQLNSVCKGIL